LPGWAQPAPELLEDELLDELLEVRPEELLLDELLEVRPEELLDELLEVRPEELLLEEDELLELEDEELDEVLSSGGDPQLASANTKRLKQLMRPSALKPAVKRLALQPAPGVVCSFIIALFLCHSIQAGCPALKGVAQPGLGCATTDALIAHCKVIYINSA
jgi:hypothetical protein